MIPEPEPCPVCGSAPILVREYHGAPHLNEYRCCSYESVLGSWNAYALERRVGRVVLEYDLDSLHDAHLSDDESRRQVLTEIRDAASE